MAPAKKKEPATTEADSEMEEPKLEATKGKAKGTGKAAQASKSSGDLTEAMQKNAQRHPERSKVVLAVEAQRLKAHALAHHLVPRRIFREGEPQRR